MTTRTTAGAAGRSSRRPGGSHLRLVTAEDLPPQPADPPQQRVTPTREASPQRGAPPRPTPQRAVTAPPVAPPQRRLTPSRAASPLGAAQAEALGWPSSGSAAEWQEQALQMLTRRPLTTAEMRAPLRRRGAEEADTCEVVDRFTSAGLLDDAAYAADYVLRRGRDRGSAALMRELVAKGIDPAVVTDAVGDPGAPDEDAVARALVAKRLPGLAGLPPAVRVRRLSAQLARRGFPAATVRRLVQEVVAADAWPDPDEDNPEE